jgi:hypothetical protein
MQFSLTPKSARCTTASVTPALAGVCLAVDSTLPSSRISATSLANFLDSAIYLAETALAAALAHSAAQTCGKISPSNLKKLPSAPKRKLLTESMSSAKSAAAREALRAKLPPRAGLAEAVVKSDISKDFSALRAPAPPVTARVA